MPIRALPMSSLRLPLIRGQLSVVDWQLVIKRVERIKVRLLAGRQMFDNIVIAAKIVATWRRDSTRGFLWKVDFSKAYDSIDWRFLWNVLQRRGFSETWVRWVKQYVTTPTFANLVNRRPQGGRIHP